MGHILATVVSGIAGHKSIKDRLRLSTSRTLTADSLPQPSPARDVVAEPTHVPVERDFAAEEKAKNLSIERQVCVKAVGRIASKQPLDKFTAADWLAFFQGWIETGTFPFDVTHQSVDTPNFQDPNQDDSDLPAELRADYKG